jgi:hypothetical protein
MRYGFPQIHTLDGFTFRSFAPLDYLAFKNFMGDAITNFKPLAYPLPHLIEQSTLLTFL